MNDPFRPYRKAFRSAGRTRALREHTRDVRFEKVLSVIGVIPPRG